MGVCVNVYVCESECACVCMRVCVRTAINFKQIMRRMLCVCVRACVCVRVRAHHRWVERIPKLEKNPFDPTNLYECWSCPTTLWWRVYVCAWACVVCVCAWACVVCACACVCVS